MHLQIHSPSQGHLSCFQVLTIINKAAINIHLYTYFDKKKENQGRFTIKVRIAITTSRNEESVQTGDKAIAFDLAG